MKKILNILVFASVATLFSCYEAHPGTGNYTSIQDFFSKNDVPMQTYTINGTTGGSFTSPQGTVVTIPTNAFITQSSIPVTGNVTIEFKDVYKKSDMMLSNITTISTAGYPLQSGGEFYLKASYNGSAVLIANGKHISVSQPQNLTNQDTAMTMTPFVFNATDTVGLNPGWVATTTDSINTTISSFIYNIYQFNSPIENGGWFNCDHPFASYTSTSLTFHPNDNFGSNAKVFLMFDNISSGVMIYNSGIDFMYSYAPLGYQGTVVAVGVQDEKLYSSFTHITIGLDEVYNFSLSETTTNDFMNHIESLN